VKCASPSKKVPIKVEFSEGMCVNIITDRLWLLENLLCLVSNAQKFTTLGFITIRFVLESSDPEKILQNKDLAERSSRDCQNVNDSPTSIPNKQKQQQLLQLVRVEVEDSGIGIRLEERSELFQPFKQAQRRAGGTGLGLYSILKRVEALGGNCGVGDRRDQISGSCFWFTFPYRPDESVSSFEIIHHRSHNFLEDLVHNLSNLHGLPNSDPNFLQIEEYQSQDQNTIDLHVNESKNNLPATYQRSKSEEINCLRHDSQNRILLVEDSVLIQKTTRRALTQEGYLVDLAQNGAECLKMLTCNEYDFILMDIQMPVMDGIEATKRIRNIESESRPDLECGLPKDLSKNMPNFQKCRQIIIGISANSDNVTMSNALLAGMDEFLSKPLSILELRECFDRLGKSKGK
jgi:CheY-like chemotaxis protein